VATVWLSFSKVKKIARTYSFLMVINPESPTERKMIELSDENKSSLTEDVQLFLIEKPLV
jgi:hypothetical protein